MRRFAAEGSPLRPSLLPRKLRRGSDRHSRLAMPGAVRALCELGGAQLSRIARLNTAMPRWPNASPFAIGRKTRFKDESRRRHDDSYLKYGRPGLCRGKVIPRRWYVSLTIASQSQSQIRKNTNCVSIIGDLFNLLETP